MPSAALFDFRDASIHGDPKWTKASPTFARRAPLAVFILGILSIIEIVIGVVWITSIDSLTSSSSLTFAQIIQPLIVPALSFFNAIPSLHLHVLARSNNPLLALWFSGILAVVFFGSAVVFIPPCTHLRAGDGSPEDTSTIGDAGVSTYQNTECPTGSRRGVWAAMVALQFVSAIGYAVHAAMGWRVWRGLKEHETGIRSGDIVEMVDEEEKRRREEEARKRWREMQGNL
ncbi:hypothetical protein PMZ80_007744 [Knufia obscura]|uniref:Uncharacterized protein n=2 Tax=Knufia TaxID=430999 RepID=A0AAN8ELV4_9EURO|nr:hypothetical protein PMZ80_007744 [Knufia obscura]KAK5954278.1 hypothetical protein OHC33_004851 [Knufia fluminis]